MRRIILSLAAVSLMASAAGVMAQAQPSLAERRAIATYEKEQYPAWQKKIQQAAGFDVPIEVNWNSIAMPGDAEHYAKDDYFVKTIFQPIEVALADITKDDMGKAALKDKLKKISVVYNEAGASASAYKERVKFDAGVLTVNFRPFTNTDEVKDRADAIRLALEAKL
ncbi:hypothetical protein [Pigmentiphaga aceris]|uniref:hypothetical protein n=1 Tax=Pigmentiphaga aceris TaxID=1940612 RepID=UPI001CA37D98|nr:hypothetical protein [Pigmentiphaga aceris]